MSKLDLEGLVACLRTSSRKGNSDGGMGWRTGRIVQIGAGRIAVVLEVEGEESKEEEGQEDEDGEKFKT